MTEMLVGNAIGLLIGLIAGLIIINYGEEK
jgi:uncharacterized membrane-anchored protein YhcB (DUF1043 family)